MSGDGSVARAEAPNGDLEALRVTLRRKAYALKEETTFFAAELAGRDAEAAAAVTRARLALFEAWTALCAPPDDHEDDDH